MRHGAICDYEMMHFVEEILAVRPYRLTLRFNTGEVRVVSDLWMCAAIKHPALRIWQVVKPVLVEHIGLVSTYGSGKSETWK